MLYFLYFFFHRIKQSAKSTINKRGAKIGFLAQFLLLFISIHMKAPIILKFSFTICNFGQFSLKYGGMVLDG